MRSRHRKSNGRKNGSLVADTVKGVVGDNNILVQVHPERAVGRSGSNPAGRLKGPDLRISCVRYGLLSTTPNRRRGTAVHSTLFQAARTAYTARIASSISSCRNER